MRRRQRKIAAAAGAMLLIPIVVAGEPVSIASQSDSSALRDVGRGLVGLVDPSAVSGDGDLSDSDQIGADLLRDAGNPDALKQLGLDLPSGPLGIPGVMLSAYQRAATLLATQIPNCHMDWPLLASIGRIESNHARGGQVFANGDTIRPILGPVLNGGGFAAITDTDGGSLDGDTRWDRAVGVMQFIPSTWRQYASDGNGDKVANPHNVFDAALAAGKYLCSGGLDMANPQQRAIAVFRYNHSDSYVRTVLIWADAYAKGVTPLPSTPVPPLQQAIAPPVDPSSTPTTPTDPSSTTTTTTTTTTTSTTTTTTTCTPTSTPTPTSTTTTTTTPTCTTTTTTTPTTTTPTTTTEPPTTTTTPQSGTAADPTLSTNSGTLSDSSSTHIEITTTTVAPPPAEESSSSAAQ